MQKSHRSDFFSDSSCLFTLFASCLPQRLLIDKQPLEHKGKFEPKVPSETLRLPPSSAEGHVSPA